MKITTLTPERIALQTTVRNEWVSRALSPRPLDIDAIRAALPLLYAKCERPPAVIIRASSPLACQMWRWHLRASVDDSVRASVYASVRASVDDSVYASVRASVSASVDDSVRASVDASVYASVYASVSASVDDSVRASVYASVRASVDDSVYASVRASVSASVDDSVRASVRASVDDSVDDSVYDSVRASVGDYCYPAWSADVSWTSLAAYVDYYQRIGLAFAEEADAYRLYQRNSGVFYALATRAAVIVCAAPDVLHRDTEGRLHCESGPAIAWEDGYKIWAWHGTLIPGEWIEQRATLDPTVALTHPNIEQRRCAAEIIGWARVLEQLPHTIVDTDVDPQIGTLLRVDLPDSPGEQFLKVKCGTGRDFCLPVPPEVNTALDAQAWMWQLPAEQFRKLEART